MFFRLSVHSGVHMFDALEWPEISFFLLVLSFASRTRALFSPPSPEIRSPKLQVERIRYDTREDTRAKKTASVTSAVHRTESGTFFVIKRSEILEKASSRIKRTVDIKAQSKIRRPRKKRAERRKRWLLFARQMAV